MGRPAATTPRNGPTAQGDLAPVNSQVIHNPLDDAANVLPTPGSPYRTSDTGPISDCSFSDIGPFQFNHLAHGNSQQSLNSQFEIGREPFANGAKRFGYA